MSKHTPGPWTQHYKMRDCVTFQGKRGVENLFLENVHGYYACQNEADAALIAAAPDLLIALKDCQDALRIHAPEVWALEQANKAIAKAEGTS